MRIEARKHREKSIASEIYSQGAWKVNPPIYLDSSGQPCLYMVSLGGGYAGGDRYKAEIRLSEQAELLLTTLSSNKIFRSRGKPVIQEIDIYLARGSVLEYLPDNTIAYQDAHYEQSTVIRMESGATLIYTDLITPGWAPDGSVFRYDTLKLRTEIYLDDHLVVFDHIRLCPGAQNIQGIGLLEGYTHYGSMIVIGQQATPEFLDKLHESLDVGQSQVRLGLSMLMIPGFTLRILAFSTQAIESVFQSCHRMIREEWFEKQPISFRKY
nr:urease accessory protein UreD [Cohnella mopanensis]